MKKIIAILLFLLLANNTFGASENLDEMDARKSRIATSTWSKAYLEDPDTLVWQPETLTYTDISTGHEVTKINASVGIKNSLPDIAWAHWSADGKRFSFGSHRDTSANDSGWETDLNPSRQGAVMMMRSDGTYLRAADNAPFEVYVQRRYLNWSPVEPDTYYGFGGNYASEGLNPDDLYRVVVGDTSINKTLILDFNLGSDVSLSKTMGADGKTLLASQGSNKYPVTIFPHESTAINDSDGWAYNRILDDYWGNTPGIENNDYGYWHDAFIRGIGGNEWVYFVPEGFSVWWRVRVAGSAPDGGPLHVQDHTAPYDWGGEVEPVLTGFSSGGGNCVSGYRSPWNCDSNPSTGPESYLSHPGFDRWGNLVAGVNSQQHKAWGVWNLKNNTWVNANIPAPHYDWHCDWSSWSDYFVSSPSAVHETGDMLYNSKYDGSVSEAIAGTHVREAGNTEYNSLPRATQSPDGTKVNFHSDFLQATGTKAWDLFQAVAYYPYPPEITVTSAIGGTATIRFDWQNTLSDPNPRTYTTRGWPNETIDDRPIPREINKYRLWRSTDNENWTPIKTIDANHFDRFDFANGGFKAGQNSYWEITDTPGNGTFYYGVTSIEHSGLESRTLSNVFAVTIIDGSGTGSQDVAYPDDPGGDSDFYDYLLAAELPKAPSNFTIDSTNKSNGHYRLSWTEPVDKTLIRYYNIYYSTGVGPYPRQKYRIASVPVGTTTWLDWCADKTKDGKYKITSVDTQGNETDVFRTRMAKKSCDPCE